jgi:methyltransferase
MVSRSQLLFLGLVGLVALERFFELALSRRNAARALARGAVEVGKRHFPAMVALHTLFLIACAAEVVFLRRPFPGLLGYGALALALLAQGLRYWAVLALGERWNTRIIVFPGAPPVTGGPYRFVRHPNYLAVIAEVLFLPLVHGAILTAAVFSAANALLLAVRVRAEEAALGEGWARAFEGAPRFIPGGRRG